MKEVKKLLKRLVKTIKKPEMRILPGQLAYFLVLSIIPIITLFAFMGSFFDISVQEDYAGISDAQVLIYFEVNDDNSAGLVTDTVDFQLEFWCKRLGERVTTNHTYNPSVVVGQAQQHDLFVATVNCPPVPDSLVSFRLELNTITSEVDDVIINYVKLRYPTYHPALERD